MGFIEMGPTIVAWAFVQCWFYHKVRVDYHIRYNYLIMM